MGTERRIERVTVAKGPLAETGLDSAMFAGIIEDLVNLLGDRYEKVLPFQYSSSKDIQRAQEIAGHLLPACELPGFDRLVQTLDASSLFHHLFVAAVAGRLSSRVSVELEPAVADAKPDLRLDTSSGPLYIECKCVDLDLDPYLSAHQKLFQAVRRLRGPLNLHIDYDEDLTEEKIDALVTKLRQVLPFVKGEGHLIRKEGLHVRWQAPDGLHQVRQRTATAVSVYGTSWSLDHDVLRPLSIYGQGQHQLAVSGPLKDASGVLGDKIRKVRRQWKAAAPYVLAIDSNTVLGKWSDHLTCLNGFFGPNKNTRISGVLFVRANIKDNAVMLEPNPYAQHPLNQECINLLRG